MTIKAKWILAGLLVICWGSASIFCAHLMRSLYEYKSKYDMLARQQEYSSHQSAYLAKASNELMRRLAKNDEKMSEVAREMLDNKHTHTRDDYIRWLCTASHCEPKSTFDRKDT